MSDIRALLLTDVVNSTKLSEQIGDQAMAQVWLSHDRVARDLLPLWRGREIDKTDGMLLMFDDASDAVQYALAYHQALAALAVPLQARAGLHVGAVILRENSAADIALGGKPLEVDGLAKPTAARVMSLARGGQTLLTPEARAAVAPLLDGPGLHAVSHGHWLLKGVADPLELFEVGPEPLAFVAPVGNDKVHRVLRVGERWLPLREVPNNLPEQPNAFIGRERELFELKALLHKARLVTLLGMGGLGKSRLSLQAAAELMAHYPDGVWFIDLAPLRDGKLVLAEAAQVLGLREEPGRPLLVSLEQLLKDRRVLLVVDNCEHLLPAAASLIHAVLQAAPKVAVMASSRASLRIPGEHIYAVKPLPLPAASDGLATLSRSTAVRLFVARAREQRPDFELSEAEAPAVAELVARLEGIPLALELAAARLLALSVSEINRRLKNRFKLLTGGSLVRDERQQTLRGLVDWSYDMLEAPERAALQRLAVFRGGFDLPAAEAVCADAELEADEVMDLVASLVEKSLVAMEQRDGESRFRMLETIREYAGEKLAESQGMQAAAAARHCHYFFDLSKRGRDGMQGPQQRQWLDRLGLEHDNLRAAMRVPQTDDSGVDPFVALKMAVALQNFWVVRGFSTEGRTAVAEMLAHAAVAASATARAHGLYVGAVLALTQGELAEALRMLEECLLLRRQGGTSVEVASTLSTLTATRLSSGDIEGARRDGCEAVALFGQSTHRVGQAISTTQLGQVEAHAGELEAARGYLHAALVIAKAIGNLDTEGEAEMVLGEVAMDSGDEAQARQHLQRSLQVFADAGDPRGEASARCALGGLALRVGDPASAGPWLHDALVAFDGFEMRGPWVGCLEAHAELALAMHDATLACGLAAAAHRLRGGLQLVRAPAQQARWLRLLEAVRSRLGDAAYDAAWTVGTAWDGGELRRLALGLGAAALA